jgi:CRP-like cAMP-binding protein
MLSSEKAGSAAVKLVDFGSAQVMTQSDNDESFETEAPKRPSAATPAYSPPEFLVNQDMQHMEPSFDLWSLGIVLYICLTGVHPFDLYGNASDEEIEHEIRSGHRPPTRNSPLTAHLSPHAIKLMERLLEWDPKKRMTAMELLEDPWVRGETARRKKMADSDKRLSAYRTFKTKLEAHLFKSMISWSEEADTKDNDGVAKRTSLVERAFRALDPDDRGYVTARELKKMTADDDDHTEGSDHQLSLSGFSDLLSENMKNIHFPKGHLVYKEGDVGNAMYFINSGSVEVYTHDGSRQVRNSGSFYGEGALLNPLRIRSASVRCLTPVHAIEISREYFEKYIASDQNIKLNLGEKNKDRKRQRAKAMLQLQKNMKPKVIKKGDFVFKKGEEGKCMYVLEDGQIDLQINGHKISSVHKGEMTGEHALIFGKPRNVDAQCVSDVCKLETLKASDFYRLLDSHPTLKEGIREIALRREFMKALCFNLNRPFPTSDAELKSAFDAVDTSKRGALELSQVRTLIQKFDPTYTEQDVRDIINSLALHEANRVTWAEFIHIFGYDNKERTVGLFSNSSD